MFCPTRISSHPLDILWHYATGYMPDFLNRRDGAAGWVRWSHRGVQFLDKLKFSKSQKRYVMSAAFDFRLDQSFEEVVRACADTSRLNLDTYSCDTWLTEELIRGLVKLHRMGYAHSYEAWADGQLAGGTFGITLGGYVSMMSMFHRVDNAGKLAVGRGMLYLRERGYRFVDIGMVPKHSVNFGAQWLPRWQYEALLAEEIGRRVSFCDARPGPLTPSIIRAGAWLTRRWRAIRRRMVTE